VGPGVQHGSESSMATSPRRPAGWAGSVVGQHGVASAVGAVRLAAVRQGGPPGLTSVSRRVSPLGTWGRCRCRHGSWPSCHLGRPGLGLVGLAWLAWPGRPGLVGLTAVVSATREHVRMTPPSPTRRRRRRSARGRAVQPIHEFLRTGATRKPARGRRRVHRYTRPESQVVGAPAAKRAMLVRIVGVPPPIDESSRHRRSAGSAR
jgi:hypothetical protein